MPEKVKPESNKLGRHIIALDQSSTRIRFAHSHFTHSHFTHTFTYSHIHDMNTAVFSPPENPTNAPSFTSYSIIQGDTISVTTKSWTKIEWR